MLIISQNSSSAASAIATWSVAGQGLFSNVAQLQMIFKLPTTTSHTSRAVQVQYGPYIYLQLR